MEEHIKRRNEDAGSCLLKRQKRGSENFINFVTEPPTLQNIAITTIGIRLWMQSKIIRNLEKGECFVERFRFRFEECCRILEEEVLKQLESFLPYSLKMEVFNVILPIGRQLSEYFDAEVRGLRGFRFLESSIHWTVEGTIDRARSLEEHINNGNLDIEGYTMYELACKYCLEGYVLDLWKKIPPSKRRSFAHLRDDIVLYWTLVLENNLQQIVQEFNLFGIYSRDFSINQNMVSCSVYFNNPYALKYFWKKLTESEKNVGIVPWIQTIIQRIKNYEDYYSKAYILCFLLSHLNDECQQKEIFTNHPIVILKCLFRSWPFRRFLLSVMLTTFDSLREDVYVSIMTDVVDSIGEDRGTEKILTSIWVSSPSKLKNAFLEQDYWLIFKLVMKLVKVDAPYTAVLILRDTSLEKKKDIATNLICKSDFKEFLCSDKDLDIIAPVLEEIFLEDGNIQQVKLRLLQYYTQGFFHFYTLIEGGDIQAIDKLLKWTIQSLSEVQDYKTKHFDPFRISFLLLRNEACERNRIHQFLRWYFGSEEKIRDFKRAFLRQDSHYHFKEILLKFAPVCNSWRRFETLKNHFLSASENIAIADFKKVCLNCVESIVEKRHFAFASRILNWCYDNPQEVKRFKELLFTEMGIKRTFSADPLVWDLAVDLLKWSSPLSKETVAELEFFLNRRQEHVEGYGCLWHKRRQDFFQLLDNVVK